MLLRQCVARKIPGGHLFPLEYPAAAAGAVHQMAQALLHADPAAPAFTRIK
jgi:hypothetical protein